MPSVNPKLEKQASTEAADPIRQALIAVEHKIRNLEKRKGKLEQYRDIVKNGGELNADQKSAVAKYEEVLLTLDVTRDLFKSINTVANDAAKQQKKLARKEAAERLQQDIAKVWQILSIQNTLSSICDPLVREDFLSGANGAVKLTEDEFKVVDRLCSELLLEYGEMEVIETTLSQQFRRVAEHYVYVVEGKQKDFAGTSYSELKKIITSIQSCGYFEKNTDNSKQKATQLFAKKQQANADVQAEQQLQQQQQQQQAQAENELNNLENNLAAPPQPETVIPSALPVVPEAAPFPVPPTHPQMPLASDPSYMNMFPGPPMAHQLPSQLSQQASALAAGVPQQQQRPQSALSPALQQQQQQEPLPQRRSSPMLKDVISEPSVPFCFLQDSELDHPEASAASSVSQTPAIVSHIPSVAAATVVASAVSLNAIPTQTFTNQSFAPPPHVVPTPVIGYPSPADISHLPTFGSANPPPPIPMPPSHPAGLQFSQQSMGSFAPQQTQTFEQQMKQQQQHHHHQEIIGTQKEEMHNNLDKMGNDNIMIGDNELGQNNSSSEWGDATETTNDWGHESSMQSGQDLQKSQSWGDQPRNNFRGRGPRRGNTNGYRGRGGYQQNGRNSYYRSNNEGGNNNYQTNGYQQQQQQQRNWSSNNGDGNGSGGGYNNKPRGPPRGDRNNVDNRPPRISGGGNSGGGGNGSGIGGGQFRGSNQRGGGGGPGNPRNSYVPRGGKAQN